MILWKVVLVKDPPLDAALTTPCTLHPCTLQACGQLSTKQAQEVRLLLVELDGDAAAMAAFEDRTYPLLVMAARSGHEGPQQVVELVQALRAKLKRQHGGQ
jgi:hypothetical protein